MVSDRASVRDVARCRDSRTVRHPAGAQRLTNAGRVCRIRAGHHPRTGQRWPCAGQEGGHEARAASAVKPAIEARIRKLRSEGMGILKIGRTIRIGTSVVQRVLIGT
jgi:hypothetical protein